jgi:2'-5' RNA ligase
MRLFVAVDLGDHVRRAASTASRQIADRIRQLDVRARIGWVAEANLHLTLRFIGEVDEPTGAAVRDVMVPPLDHEPFELGIAGAGAFPPHGDLRTIWLGVSTGAAELAAVSRTVEQRMVSVGLPPERRAFTAHLTIGRVKDIGRGQAAGVRRALVAVVEEEVRCRVGLVTLYRSRLTPRGAEYEALLRTPLGGSGRA